MFKRSIGILLAVALTFSMMGCGSNSDNKSENTQTEAGKTEAKDTASKKVKAVTYNPTDYVTLGQYEELEITPIATEVTDADVEAQFESTIKANAYVKDESATEVKADSIVNVNYCGKLDGVAFEGGTSEDVMVDVAGNCSVKGGAYIEGFTAGLPGAKVGEEIDCDITFPENYGSAELAGKAVVFTFTINYVAKAIDISEVDDAFVKENFDLESVDKMKESIRTMLESNAEGNKETNIREQIIANISNNAQVTTLPQELIERRLNKMIAEYEAYYCQEGQTLKEYAEQTGQNYDDFINNQKTSVIETVGQEMIFLAIANEKELGKDEEGFAAYKSDEVSYYGDEYIGSMTDLYSYYDGEPVDEILHRLYAIDEVLDYCRKSAVIK